MPADRKKTWKAASRARMKSITKRLL
jgi:hypothetical protein